MKKEIFGVSGPLSPVVGQSDRSPETDKNNVAELKQNKNDDGIIGHSNIFNNFRNGHGLYFSRAEWSVTCKNSNAQQKSGKYNKRGDLHRQTSAGQRASQRTFGGNTLTSGTNLDGTWEAPLTIRQFSEAGTWNLSRLRFKDTTNNVVSLRTTDFAALGIPTELVVIRPSLDADGTIGAAGGTVTDATFGDRAELSVPAGLLADNTAISIDVFQDPIDVPMPTGFSADGTRFVNVNFTPEPNFPVAVPGITITLPLVDARVPGSSLALFKIDTVTATLVPSISVFGGQVIGTVNADGLSATFPGVAGFSTVIGLPEIIIGDLNGDSCVDRADFTLLRAIYRNGNADLANDLNGDGVVNIADLRTLIRNFTNPRGASCDQPAP